MTTKTERVKLQVYINEPKETLIDTFYAKEWDDFVIISLDEGELSDDEISGVVDTLNAWAKSNADKQVLLFTRKADVSFVGLREVIEEDE